MSQTPHFSWPAGTAHASGSRSSAPAWRVSLWHAALCLALAMAPGCLFSENFAEKPLRTSANSSANSQSPDAGQPDGGEVVDNNAGNHTNGAGQALPEKTYVMPVSATGRARSANYQIQLRMGEGPATGLVQSPQGSVRLGAPAASSPPVATAQP